MKLGKKLSVALLSLVMFTGVAAGAGQHSAHASQIKTTAVNQSKIQKQHSAQNQPNLIHKVNQKSQRNHKSNWFRDGLNKRNLAARSWVTYRESGHRWNVLSVNGRCIGYFQLDPSYLGRKNGHVNLSHKHQVKVGDAYAASRYGSWVGAKRFWQAHGWY